MNLTRGTYSTLDRFFVFSSMLSQKKKLAAICGSTKSTSLNLSLIYAIADLTASDFELTVISNIDQIPHFNPQLDNDAPPENVVVFREQLKNADAILICTPEYAMGVPGTLKNAIDWTVSSCEFSHKPTALITASSQGFKGHTSLLETLKVIEANITDQTQLIISYVKTKVSADGFIKDEEAKQQVMDVMRNLRISI
jgi:NAD(P)H-dependent FMN reductase